ncbi:hypothetical protein RCH12_002204 [Cryobacterium sp. MP_3.1]|uniref:hypothetical protein n=1 Tax=Cryobacterium sp. MP_3.1 TaxID=3071711 RepID=UPI002E0A2441|nr:hypothetical protein [Cryobacterium sp. MP_3.1]
MPAEATGAGRAPVPVAGPATFPGRITVRQRALNTVARAVSAEALGVPPAQVTVTLQDDRGRLGVSVVAPISVPDLDTVTPGDAGDSVLHRVRDAQAQIRAGTTRLTGYQVGQVDVRVSGARIGDDVRVR